MKKKPRADFYPEYPCPFAVCSYRLSAVTPTEQVISLNPRRVLIQDGVDLGLGFVVEVEFGFEELLERVGKR